ncbi:MAG: PIG-L family deacetylase [Parachlamydiales bacterium]
MFISPHLDDAVFSSGGLMIDLRSKGVPITVINIFTRSDGQDSISAKRYISQCGYTNSKKLYEDRVHEDKSVLNSIGIEVINLGFVDALWRKRKENIFLNYLSKIIPEIGLIYPTYRWHVTKGIVSPLDGNNKKDIVKSVQSVRQYKEAKYIFIPIGIGNHVDHLIVKDILDADNSKKIIFWADYPYIVRDMTQINLNFIRETYKPNWVKKMILMKKYKTQFNAIFSSKINKSDEYYFYKKT